MKKAQANFEFIISVMVFISVNSFITIQTINNVTMMRRDLAIEDMKSTAFQISSIIMTDEGYPEGWDSSNVERIGLSTGFYSLSMDKINELKDLCESENGYRKFLSVVGLEISKDVYLNVSTLQGETLVLCAPNVESIIRNRAEILRTSFVQGKGIVKVNVRVIV